MARRHFKGRRSHHAIIILCMAIALMAILVLFIFHHTVFSALMVLAGATLAMALIAVFLLGRKEDIEYELGEDRLLLRRGAIREQLGLHEVQDANLIDLVSARDYVNERMEAAPSVAEASEIQRTLTCFCGIPLVGLMAVGSGIRRTNIRNFRRTLVLLRIRDGRTMILSPKHSESMVSAIEKALVPFRSVA